MASNFQSREERYEVGRALARLLREQAPKLLSIDEYGYASVDDVITAMKNQGFDIGTEHVKEIIVKDAQYRFELINDKVRAKAGHKYHVEPDSPNITPPEYYYHGTSNAALAGIFSVGILPIDKAYVHLASTIQRARTIGLRKSGNPVVLRVKALEAHNAGIRFWKSGQISPDGEIILSDPIPPRFIEKIEEES